MARLIKEDIIRDLGRLWGAATLVEKFRGEVDKACARILAGAERYKYVADAIFCPWWAIGIIHGLECGWSFDKHLHNGDPLSKPTTRVPAGRPAGWASLPEKERTWERSAIDALRRLGWDKVPKWTIPELLYRLELYNGMGYRLYHPEVPTPYLWSKTTVYKSGKYVEEEIAKNTWKSVWKPALVSQQMGAAAIIKSLHEQGIAFPSTTTPADPPAPSSDIIEFPRGGNVQLLPNFHLREFACHCGKCPVVLVSATHMARLQQLRNALGVPITITSGHRCARHNAEVASEDTTQQHVKGTATDVKAKGKTVAQVVAEAEKIWTDGGIGTYRTFVHLDSRGTRARWKG